MTATYTINAATGSAARGAHRLQSSLERVHPVQNAPRWYRLVTWLGVPLMIVITLQRLNALT